jgi:hypothetical protein
MLGRKRKLGGEQRTSRCWRQTDEQSRRKRRRTRRRRKRRKRRRTQAWLRRELHRRS